MHLKYKLYSLNGGLAFMAGSMRRSVCVPVISVYSLYLGFRRKRSGSVGWFDVYLPE